MKNASHALLAVSLIATAVTNGLMITGDERSTRRRSARRAVVVLVPLVALGIAGVLLT
ncbi:hypothetical protein [Streptomyces pimonensis]